MFARLKVDLAEWEVRRIGGDGVTHIKRTPPSWFRPGLEQAEKVAREFAEECWQKDKNQKQPLPETMHIEIRLKGQRGVMTFSFFWAVRAWACGLVQSEDVWVPRRDVSSTS